MINIAKKKRNDIRQDLCVIDDANTPTHSYNNNNNNININNNNNNNNNNINNKSLIKRVPGL